ncbi:MAG: hypothetical protein IPN63_00770 [Gammaproteobacteria bacterium]|nr:hypothetical protein [Gammaproteobacteria bacterium]
MSIEFKLLKELDELRAAHERADYFFVVVLAPQLLVQIIDTLASYSEEWIERKITSKFTREEKEVYRLAGQLQKKESDRSYIVGALVSIFESGHWEACSAKSNFVKYFTKLDDLVSLRNVFSHEYYIKEISINRAKNCSKAGIQLAELFAEQLYSEGENA